MSGASGRALAGLHAALLLARGRAEGVRHLHNDLRTASGSFWAAAVALPAYLCLRLIGWSLDGLPAHAGHAAALDLVTYVIGWVGYVVLSRPLVAALGRAGQWPRFVAVWNWCNVVQYLLLVVASLPLLLGAPDWVGETTGLVALGWALWLEWFAARAALNVAAIPACALVALDVVLGLLLSGLSDAALGP